MDMYTKKYDEKLKNIEDIFWMPHVGKDYQQADKKLFVLGLSYWPWGPYAPPYKMGKTSEGFERGLVHDFVSEYEQGQGARWKDYNYAVIDLLLGTNPSATDVETAFFRMAKTNFIQNSAHANVNQNRKETKKSVRVIDGILQVLQPTHILVCAKSVWNWIGNTEYIKEHKEKVLWVYHPSSWMTQWRYKKDLPRYRDTIKKWNLELTKK